MLAIQEKRQFKNEEKIWFGVYHHLSNALHWHDECELIHIVKGNATIRIGEHCFEGNEGEFFFCSGEELHSIISEQGAEIEIMIFDRTIAQEITDQYTLRTPKVSATEEMAETYQAIRKELSQKKPFFQKAIEGYGQALITEIFRNPFEKRAENSLDFYKNLLRKINEEFAFITFEDAALYSGYSPSHFSKLFKKRSGMNFSEYLNRIKVENAIELMHRNSSLTMTALSNLCGFSTIRNFNRVFKELTGFAPRALPKDFAIRNGLAVSQKETFDPTDQKSVLIK